MSLPSQSAIVATTDATLTTLLTIAIPSNKIVTIIGRVTARRTGGTAGTAEDGAFFIYNGAYNNISGTATLIGEDFINVGASQVDWTLTSAVSSGNLLLQVTGAVDNNINWTGYVELLTQG